MFNQTITSIATKVVVYSCHKKNLQLYLLFKKELRGLLSQPRNPSDFCPWMARRDLENKNNTMNVTVRKCFYCEN